MEKEIPLFPIAGWFVGPIKPLELVTFKLDFLTSPMQPLEEVNHTQHYALTAAQALEFADALQRAVRKLESAEFQAPPGQKH